jgi:DNA-binding transcriptional regulator YiaG
LRRKLALTQAELAKELGVHPLTVARWEWGKVRVTKPMARLLDMIRKAAPKTAKGGRRR